MSRTAAPKSKRASRKPPLPARSPLYDRLTRPLLAGVLIVAVVAWLLHLLAAAAADLAGTEMSSVWLRAEQIVGWQSDTIRLLTFSLLHIVLYVALMGSLYRPVERARAGVAARTRPAFVYIEREVLRARKTQPGRGVERGLSRLREIASPPDALRAALLLSARALTTGMLILLLLQPTLVPLRLGRETWLLRGANLADGTASAHLVDSVAALARWWHAAPVQAAKTVQVMDFDADLHDSSVPLIDRWDAYLLEATEGDRELFAKTKAFMWVESGGRQYALSATGCAGLMQFCAPTAQRRPFHSIFGAGAVSSCGCSDCSVPREVARSLETDPGAVAEHFETFPCDLSDARFDPERSVRAGVAYVRELASATGGELPLMYIGYNSGPRISRALYETLGKKQGITVADLRPHLASALRPYYGERATPRANGLLDVHLPKLIAAYERWRK